MNKQRIFSIILAIVLLSVTEIYAATYPVGMHPKSQIDFVKKQIKLKKEPFLAAYNQFIIKADSALLVENHALVDFSVPGFYVKKEEHRRNSMALQVDGFSAYSCALAWQLTGLKKYADKAVYFLNAWASINKTYSQLDGSLVMSYSGTTLLISADLMRNYRGWTSDDQAQFAAWTKDVYRKGAMGIRARHNNSGDWGRIASVLADCYLDDKADIQTVAQLIKADMFDKIAPDGHMVEEVKREGNGIWYTYFSLAPLTASCWVIYNVTGENLFAMEKDGTSIKKALDYLLYYNGHPDEWKWFKNPVTGHVDTPTGFWPANLMEAMGDIYKEEKYKAFVAPYRPILYKKHDFAWTFPTLMPLSLTNYNNPN